MLFKNIKVGEFFYSYWFDAKIMRIEDVYPMVDPDDEDKRPVNAVLVGGRTAGTALTFNDDEEVTRA